MAKSVLTPFQKVILDAVCKEKFITDNFWMAGGTALSEFYLQHRLSDDFDFFTDSEIDLEEIRKKLSGIIKQPEIKSVEYRTVQSSKVFFLKSGQKEVVKTDFNYFPFPKFGKMKNYKGLKIASLLDIAISKLDTILIRNKARDFVDFYFIQKKHPFELDFLLKRLEKQISIGVDRLMLASSFSKVESLKDYPKILKKFSKKEMVSFFLDLAKKQKDKIVK